MKEGSDMEKSLVILNKIFKRRESGILVPLIIIFVFSGVMNPKFFQYQNIANILFQASFVAMIGVAMTFVLILAGLDLSVGSVLGLSGVVSGYALLVGIPIPVGILFGLLTGMAVGLFNGYIIAKLKMPTFIVTLSTMYMARGLCEFLTRGKPVYPLPKDFNAIGQARLMIGSFGIQWPIIIAVVLAVIGHFILTRTTFGRAVFAIGGNMETARLSGIKVVKTTIFVYVISAGCAAVSGIVTAARLGSALSNSGTGMEMNVIASCIIGGTSMFGGSGSILGTVIGALLMTTVTNAMAMLQVSVFLQKVVIGAIILIAVGIDQYSRKRSGLGN
jgi:ribose/xylose/arabinose/galactoside ABC-type transport system permease subunit